MTTFFDEEISLASHFDGKIISSANRIFFGYQWVRIFPGLKNPCSLQKFPWILRMNFWHFGRHKNGTLLTMISFLRFWKCSKNHFLREKWCSHEKLNFWDNFLLRFLNNSHGPPPCFPDTKKIFNIFFPCYKKCQLARVSRTNFQKIFDYYWLVRAFRDNRWNITKTQFLLKYPKFLRIFAQNQPDTVFHKKLANIQKSFWDGFWQANFSSQESRNIRIIQCPFWLNQFFHHAKNRPVWLFQYFRFRCQNADFPPNLNRPDLLDYKTNFSSSPRCLQHTESQKCWKNCWARYFWLIPKNFWNSARMQGFFRFRPQSPMQAMKNSQYLHQYQRKYLIFSDFPESIWKYPATKKQDL